jgi:hypothetical protein
VAWSLLGFAKFRKGGNGLLYMVRFLATVVETAISGSNFSTFDMSTLGGCGRQKIETFCKLTSYTYRRPQSSHSRTGFHPMRLVHMSHLAVNNPLVKMRSNGFQPVSPGSERRGGETFPLDRFVPGFKRVKRWTSVEGIDLIVDPPSVAAVVEIEEYAVWKVATEKAEVAFLLLTSASGPSSPFPVGLTVRMEERDGRLLPWCCLITVVL